MKTKLVYFQWNDEDKVKTSLMTDVELISFVNDMDFSGVHLVKVFDVTDYNNIFEISYVGWQPKCLIEFADSKGNIVLRGWGIDH